MKRLLIIILLIIIPTLTTPIKVITKPAGAQSPQLQQPPTPFDKDIQILNERGGRLQAQFELTMRDLNDLVKKQESWLKEQETKKTPPTPPPMPPKKEKQ